MKTFTKIQLIILTALMLAVQSIHAQKNLEKGNKLFDLNLFKDAIPFYELEVKSRNSKTLDKALLKLADCYRITGEFEKAESTYKTLLKKKKKDPKTILNYAISLKSSAKYAEASVQFKEYLKVNPKDPMGEMYLQSCDLAQKWLDETIGKEVRNVEGINSELGDFAPVLVSPGELVYSSSKPGSTEAFISFDGGNEVHRLDLYSVDVASIDHPPLGSMQNMRSVNSPLHEGPATFSSDGTELYFTRTIHGSKNRGTNEVLNPLQIFYSKKDSTGKWSKPVSAFTFNSKEYSVGHPSLSADGKTIYYMSDMPGGKGGTDIYYSVKDKNGVWSAPKNLEGDVNTFGHELFPYISQTGILYFSSDAHPGMGQLDIFHAEFENGRWTNLENMKPPINSIANDFGITLDGDVMRGFFSSDRFNGKGAEDIYSFSDPDPLRISICGDTIRFADKSIFDGIRYKLIDDAAKTEVQLEPVNGMYAIPLTQFRKYTLAAKKNGFPFNKIALELNRDTLGNYLEAKVRTTMRPVRVDGILRSTIDPKGKTPESVRGSVAVSLIDSTTIIDKDVTTANGAFKFDEILNAGDSYTVLAKYVIPKDPPDPIVACNGIVQFNGTPVTNASVQLWVDGKVKESVQTNEKGNFKFDLEVAEKYEIVAEKSGYISARVPFQTTLNDAKNGLFKTIELDSSGSINVNGNVHDLMAGIENARITIRDGNKVISEIRSSAGGKFNCPLLPDRDYQLVATANGYLQKEINLSTKKMSRGDVLPVDILLDSIKLNSVIELKNVYYDYNRPDVQGTSIPALDMLVEFMRSNPTVKIELAANTDSRGNPQYNLSLSQARAQNAKDYLTLEDIAPDRVIPVGYGKSKPIIANAKTEQEHQINRRTEIRILEK